MQLVPVPKRCLMTSIYLELIPNSLRRPFRAFRNLDLEPRARALGCPAGPLRGPWFRQKPASGPRRRGSRAQREDGPRRWKSASGAVSRTRQSEVEAGDELYVARAARLAAPVGLRRACP